VRPDPAIDPLIGTVIGGRYQLIRRIGKGGMGLVYEADHLGIGKRVAVKLLLDKYSDDPEVVARFEREARTASAIGDEHIVEVFDAGVTEDGRSYLVMELLIGLSLADVAEATGPMPAARAVPIVRQVLRGLAAAHAKGIVHRDMKPENVFLLQKPDRHDVVKIMDFGISKFLQDRESKVRLTATGAVIGTPVYMAPEQAMGTGEIDARVDLYAVGVMLYELLAGRPPFQAPTYIALVTQHLQMPPPPLQMARPDLPTALVVAVHKALEKDPRDRFASAAEMAAAMPSDAAVANLDRVATLTGPTLPDAGGTAAESPRGKKAKAAITPGGAAVPTTSRRPAPSSVGTTRRRWPWMAAIVALAGDAGRRHRRRRAAPARRCPDRGPRPSAAADPGRGGRRPRGRDRSAGRHRRDRWDRPRPHAPGGRRPERRGPHRPPEQGRLHRDRAAQVGARGARRDPVGGAGQGAGGRQRRSQAAARPARPRGGRDRAGRRQWYRRKRQRRKWQRQQRRRQR
jgi:tRNA A-37 threonylcarbamoyl transferase component Bud32